MVSGAREQFEYLCSRFTLLRTQILEQKSKYKFQSKSTFIRGVACLPIAMVLERDRRSNANTMSSRGRARSVSRMLTPYDRRLSTPRQWNAACPYLNDRTCPGPHEYVGVDCVTIDFPK